MTSERITMDDVRRAEICAGGLRSFCTEYGVSLRRLSTEGIPVEELAGIENAKLDLVLTLKRSETHGRR